MNKLNAILLVVAGMLISSLVGQLRTEPVAGEVVVGTDDGYPYQLVKMRITYDTWSYAGDEHNYITDDFFCSYNRADGKIYVIPNPLNAAMGGQYEYLIISHLDKFNQPNNPAECTPLPSTQADNYQLIANPRGGAYVFDPESGKTWVINSRGTGMVGNTAKTHMPSLQPTGGSN